MSAGVDQRELPSLSALELLKCWAGIHGPDPRTERRNRRRGTLGLYGLPTYRRHHEARRRTALNARCKDRADGGPHDMVGVTTVWSANAPPALPSA
jgi:hypothetical protein